MYKTLFEYICLIHKDISFERNRLSTELNEYVERDEQEMNGSDNPEYKEFGEWLRKQRGSHSLRWLADLLGVSPQFISKVEKGIKRPSSSNVGRLAAIFKGDPVGLAEMTGWEVTDVCKTYEITIGGPINVKEIINQVREATYNAHFVSSVGSPKRAIENLDFWIRFSEDRTKIKLDSIKNIRDLNYELIRALAKRMDCNSKILRRDEILNSMLKDHAKGISLAISLNDNKGRGIMDAWLAAAYYLKGNWEKAIKNEYKALPFTDNNPALRAEILRGLMLQNARLKKPYDFLRIERNAFEDLDHGIITAPMDIAALFDGSGRGRVFLEKPHGESRLDRAERETKVFNEQMMIKPLRDLEILCSRLIIHTKYKERGLSINSKIARETAERGFFLSKYLGYDRYVRDIEQMLRFLNIPPLENPNNDWQLHLDFLS